MVIEATAGNTFLIILTIVVCSIQIYPAEEFRLAERFKIFLVKIFVEILLPDLLYHIFLSTRKNFAMIVLNALVVQWIRTEDS